VAVTKYRIVRVTCWCRGVGTSPCFEVERRGIFGWSAFLATRDRCGDECAAHFSSEDAAMTAFQEALTPKPPKRVVISEFAA
jgi:hypothetical protein